MLTLTIQTENAAFEGANLGAELSRILRVAADKAAQISGQGTASLVLRDVNGNKVGEMEYTLWPICPVDGEPMEDGICSACLDRDHAND